jgi:sigma-E factor negative regulatory protein RseA
MNAPAPTADSVASPAALLSALADGDATVLPAACALWRDDAEARATWHAYHLIGDVLRSDDLAAPPERDAAFLAAVRARLAAEPVVLAPEPARRRSRWMAPSAVAAGVMAVAGVIVVQRLSAPPDSSGLQAMRGDGALPVVAIGQPARPVVVPVEGNRYLIRDPQLDAYLRLHRQALGGVPAAVPGGMPRNVETLAPIIPVTTQAR